ncbi:MULTISPECIES: ABC transporter ATP-binding protein [unclassified Roseitalea]|uniref:ABC transporter ATP-binding protein n=1 Tax=unclassified Roseitalea TaxID=2639107 RepID=UPI00273F588A|nr:MULTISPECIES: ABC transporter ATP-binding protein [unclassified Roseitalea]
MKADAPLLSIRDLVVDFAPGSGRLPAVDGVSFDIGARELVCVVGESGSGKSVSALAVMGLLPETAAVSGAISFEGRDLRALTRRQWRSVRGQQIGMIFQEPMTSLNPVFPIGRQLVETLRAHERMSLRASRDRAADLLDQVGIPSPRQRLDDYPHQLSGGMRQRVMIAIALSCSPRLLIADEPTTALDVTIQGQLLDLLNDLRETFATAILLITHNMGVVAEVADRVVVMYSGRIAEQADVFSIFDAPRHPYTEGLLASTPDLFSTERRLTTIVGSMPNPAAPPPGCLFAPRCPLALDMCARERPELRSVVGGQQSACLRAEQMAMGDKP